MDPNTTDYSQYDFIMNHGQKPKKGLMPSLPTGNSKKQRIILMSGLGLGLFVGLIIVSMLLSSAGKNATQPLVSIAQQQQEIIRVADLGTRSARASATSALAETTELTTTSGQQKTITYLTQKRRKVSTKELAAKQNTQTDAAFKTATANGDFDETFITTIAKLLTDYRTSLSKQYDASNNKTEKTLLKQLYTNAGTLLKNQTASTTGQ
jgi:hypothetical protein